jgi:glutathione S-transferase
MKLNDPAALTLVLERVIRAPRERVWAAWTNGDLLHRWSCPEGMHIPEASVDFRVGGEWEVVMAVDEDPSQRHVAFGKYLEIHPPERIVQDHQWRTPDGGSSPRTVVTVVFHEEGGRTRLVLTQEGFESVGERDGHREGWASTLDRLVALAEAGP